MTIEALNSPRLPEKVVSSPRVPESIVKLIEDDLAYFNGLPYDGRFHELALDIADKFWQRLEIENLAATIVRDVPAEVCRQLLEEHPEVLANLVNQLIQDSLR
jgi:hypothetical protein